MTEFLQQVVSGLAAGGIYASLALALVIIYRAMGLVNFAQGEFAMLSTFIAWLLLQVLHLPTALTYTLAAVGGIGFALLLGVGAERLVVRPFERGSQLIVVIVTLALLSIVNGLAGFIWGYVPKFFPSPLPAAPVSLAGVLVSPQDAGVIAVTLLVVGLVWLLFNRTTLGLRMRAAALYPESAGLLGVRVGRMTALGWGLASAVGAVAGIMVAPRIFLEPNMMQSVIIYAFAAAVLGGIESPLGAVAGGLILGVLLNLIGAYLPQVADIRLAVALLVLVLILLVRPAGLFGRVHVRRV
ncbi:MAG: branched-chain amino acid ABC transporter permease [Candidatus Dormibacteraeota bacterium]|nr:branched-chain amino acid ABC transporter permease [Candidatus Dormibacteraeota bacterium]